MVQLISSGTRCLTPDPPSSILRMTRPGSRTETSNLIEFGSTPPDSREFCSFSLSRSFSLSLPLFLCVSFSSPSTTYIPALLARFPVGFSLLFGYRSPRFPRISSRSFSPFRMPSLMSAPRTAQTTRPACRHFSVVARAMLNACKIDSDEVTPAGRFRESISREALLPRTHPSPPAACPAILLP